MPGWIRKPSTYAEQSLSVLTPKLRSPTGFANLADNLADLVPQERLSTWQQARDRSEALHDAAYGRLRWSEPVVGDLPDGLGRDRFFFPWFELEGGLCLHFFEIEEVEGARVAKLGDRSEDVAWAPWCPVLVSWFGVRADHGLERLKEYRSPGVIEIDWTAESAGSIEVSRNRILLSEKAEQAVESVGANLNKAMRDFAEQHAHSRYALYNCALTDGEPPPLDRWHWLCQHEREPRLEWRRLSFPVVALLGHNESMIMSESSYRWRGLAIPRFCTVTGSTQRPDKPQADGQGYRTRTTWWHSSRLAPDRVIGIVHRSRTPWGPSETSRLGMLWERAPTAQEPRVAYPKASRFDQSWRLGGLRAE